MNSQLPKYKITIDNEYSDGEDLGINQIAFTSTPAIKVKGVAFNSQEPKNQFFADKVKMRIAAPAIIPMEIYRADEEEYYVEFTEKEIDKIHQKFMKKISSNKNAVFNLEHNANETVPAYIFEAWLVENPELDKSFSSYGIKVPKGTLFVVAQVTDKEYYNQLVANEQTGFSIEGFLGLSLSEIINKKQIETKMNELTLPDGEHTIGEKIYVVKEGKVTEVKDVVKEEMSEDTTSTGETKVEMADYTNEIDTRLVDGTEVRVITKGEAISVGDMVLVKVGEGYKEAPEGKHELEGGLVIYTDAEGNINEIETKQTEERDETELAEEVVSEITDVVADATPTYTKEELDIKFEELYRLIADLKAEEEVEDEVEEVIVPVQLSVNQRLSSVVNFLKK